MDKGEQFGEQYEPQAGTIAYGVSRRNKLNAS